MHTLKKIVPFFLSTVFVLASIVPQSAGAVIDAQCSSTADCGSASEICNLSINTSNGICVPAPTTTGTGSTGSGALNTTLLRQYATSIISFINDVVVPLLGAIAFIVFIWGVFKFFILGGESEEERKTGRVFVMYGVVGFVVIFSLWGLVNVGASVLNLGGSRQFNGLHYPTL